jgi:hypothetical protein
MREIINILYLLQIRRFFHMFRSSFVLKIPLSWRLMQEAKLIYLAVYHNVDGEEN